MFSKPGEDVSTDPSADPSAEVQSDSPSGPELVPDAAQKLAAEVERLQQDNKRLTEQLLRKQAEIENFRKRTEREKQDFMQYSLLEAVKSLLPVLDGFELAMNADGGGDEYRKGIGLIHQQFMTTLQKMGLKRVESKGHEFDPRLHEAVATLATDQYPDHQILEELQPGYFFKDRLMRPAMVTVARRSGGETTEDSMPTE